MLKSILESNQHKSIRKQKYNSLLQLHLVERQQWITGLSLQELNAILQSIDLDILFRELEALLVGI
jgi:hypothetical protein